MAKGISTIVNDGPAISQTQNTQAEMLPIPLSADGAFGFGSPALPVALTLTGTYTRGTVGQNALSSTSTTSGSESNAEYGALDFAWKPNGFVNSFASQLSTGAKFTTNINNSANSGAFGGIQVINSLIATTANTQPQGGFYTSGIFVGEAAANDNGTSGLTNGKGHLFGLNANVRLKTGATFYSQIIGEEIDLAVRTGSSVEDVIGMQIVKLGDHASQGSRDNTGLSFNDAAANLPGWNIGISFGEYAGYWPMDAGGTLIGCITHAGTAPPCGTTTHGIDFRNIVFTGNAYASTGYAVDGSGNTTVKSVLLTPVTVSALPSAAAGNKGMKMFVSDANATTFASIVAGGGANGIPVYSDGTNWRIG